jgi:DNA-binding MarR family transcriptional regulator
MASKLRKQGERFHDVFSELVRAYQFRDREQICCRGVSVSQCYALEALFLRGPLTMSELAQFLFLEPSTVTRVIDRLVGTGLVERVSCDADRRVCRVAATETGRELVSQIRDDLIEGHVQVLRRAPTDTREAIIACLQNLLTAFQERQKAADCSSTTAGAAAGGAR